MEEKRAFNWHQLKQPIVYDFKNWDGIKESSHIYKEQLESFKTMVQDFKHASKTLQSRNIMISGERGTGKTSVLKTLKNILEKENYYVFDLITSDLLENNLTLFEIVLSQIYKEIQDEPEGNNGYGYDYDNMLYLKINVHKCLKKIIQALEVEKKSVKKEYYNDRPSVDVLSDLDTRVQLGEHFRKLLEQFKRYVAQTSKKGNQEKTGNDKSVQDFVLMIDDIDLVSNTDIFKMINDIQRYLDGHMIIVVAGKKEQLVESLIEVKIQESALLLRRGIIIKDDLIEQCENLLLKLIPQTQRISLFNNEELLRKNAVNFFNGLFKDKNSNNKLLELFSDIFGESSLTEMTIEQWFYSYVYTHTNLKIKPIDSKEETYLLLPKTLREMIQCCELFEQMEQFDDTNFEQVRDNVQNDNTDSKNVKKVLSFNQTSFEKLLFNLNILLKYIQERFYHLEHSDQKFIKEWYKGTSYRKNYLTYHFLFNKIRSNKYNENLDDSSEYPFRLQYAEEYNLTLGDVYAMMEYYKVLSGLNEIDYYFIYIMKVLYSIQLSQSLYKGFIERNSKSEPFLQYLSLINTRFLPENMLYFNIREYSEDYEIIRFYPDIRGLDELAEVFINSDVAAKGPMRSNITSKSGNYRYRNLYTFTKPTLTNGISYFISFFTYCTKLSYLMKSDLNGNDYLFFNLFHSDVFIRQVYNSNSPGEELYRTVLNSINNILEGSKHFQSGTNFENISSIFNTGKYYPLYKSIDEVGRFLFKMSRRYVNFYSSKKHEENLIRKMKTYGDLSKILRFRGYSADFYRQYGLIEFLKEYGQRSEVRKLLKFLDETNMRKLENKMKVFRDILNYFPTRRSSQFEQDEITNVEATDSNTNEQGESSINED